MTAGEDLRNAARRISGSAWRALQVRIRLFEQVCRRHVTGRSLWLSRCSSSRIRHREMENRLSARARCAPELL